MNHILVLRPSGSFFGHQVLVSLAADLEPGTESKVSSEGRQRGNSRRPCKMDSVSYTWMDLGFL